MTKTEILNTLARDYVAAHRVYASMKKEVEMLQAQGKPTDHAKLRAGNRFYTLSGIKRAAMALGITETEFMAAVDQLLNK